MFAPLVARLRSLWRGVSGTRQVDADLREEFRHHIEMHTADLIREGVPPAEAARRARAEFGSTDYELGEVRNARGLAWFDQLRFSWLDLKLGGRMLLKYPVLTMVGGLSMAFAICVGAGTFETVRQLLVPTIPLPASDQIVVLENWDAAANKPERRATHDFLNWRESLRSVDDLAAYRSVTRNLSVSEGLAEPVYAAELTASAFRVLRVPPLLGRTLVEADEQTDAPLVAVIGYELWRNRFQGDSAVIGRSVRVTGALATIVGVMPPRFAFPRVQEMWLPLRIAAAGHEPREGPSLEIIGRLAPDAALEQARSELTALGQVAAAVFPRTHAELRPRVVTFAESVRMLNGSEFSITMLAGNLFVLLLLVLVCANVGLLMFARAATRETEIVLRYALGASRRRIVAQMFAESLVLGAVAAVAGLAAAGWAIRWALALVRSELTDGSGSFPFWVDGQLSPTTYVYAALLTLLAAAVAGILPGLKITSNLGERLKRASAGSRSAQCGGLWTAIIVLQLAVTMGFPAVTYFVRRDAVRIETQPLPFPVDQYLAVRLEMEPLVPGPGVDTSAAALQARYLAAARHLEQRLATEPTVLGVTVAQHLPRQYHPNHRIEVNEGAVPPYDERGHLVASARVDPNYLEVMGVSMLAGRWFTGSEASPDARVAVVNKAFVDRIMGGGNPIGRRIQYPRRGATLDTLPSYEIIGVAPDMGTNSGWGPAGIYHPLVREAGLEARAGGSSGTSVYPLNVAVHLRGDPNTFAPRLRAIGTAVDPALHLTELMPLRDVVNGETSFLEFWVKITTLISAIALVLSLVAIYAVMSFAVARRTREIGVRVALGGNRRQIVRAVFAQPLRQLGLGLLAGTLLIAWLTGMTKGGLPTAYQFLMLGSYTLAMTAVFTLACVVPTMRALGVQPTEALRYE